MIYAALFTAGVALVVAAAAAVVAVRAHSTAEWAASAIRTAARGRAGRRAQAAQKPASAPARHAVVEEAAPEPQEPPTVAERPGETQEYRAVPPPGGWGR